MEKYHVDDETLALELTVEWFPDMAQFVSSEPECHQPSQLVSEWSLQRIGTLRSRLEAMLHRIHATGFRHHRSNWDSLSSYRVYQLANQVFGYDGWSTLVLHFQELYRDFDTENDRFSLRAFALVRVLLKDGFYIDAQGMGEALNLPFKYMCYSKCKKQAATDATKRAIVAMSDMHSINDLVRLDDGENPTYSVLKKEEGS